ncbi:lysine N(6)-hydroxylase/L-ornithine N(5)-oxygenase family protein [Kitasatospora sp. NPDC058965]|uniref:lysine N(6)-hydroxylase/L-ornithine N(5)-oxygenase family protein n=1 Tax=Kitasatospora sp. NPDC058965 TaxID=3346682 RepID=UPI0036C43CA5
MTHREVGVLAIGAGPANLALAVAIEESGAPELADSTLLLERAPEISWQRELLLPWARSQVSFLKDLATLRNPRSRFSFLSFLHAQGRLDEFINLGTFHPFRWEISDYLRWVAGELERVEVRCGAEAVRIDPLREPADQGPRGWLVTLADGDTVACRDLVVGAGRDAHVPAVFADLPADRVVHSSRFRSRVAELAGEPPRRAVVVGGAQSAAEMFYALHEQLPDAHLTMLVRSIGLQNYQTSKFVNELFFPSFVDEFFDSPAELRAQVLDEMRLTNYAGLAPPFLDELYLMLYQQRRRGNPRSEVLALTEVTAARVADGEVVLDLRDRRTGKVAPLACDVVLLGTGYDSRMPAMVRDLADRTGLAELAVSRNYRLELGGPSHGAVYLQGVNEATHGIADSLISVLAARAQEITTDLLARRGAEQPAAVR